MRSPGPPHTESVPVPAMTVSLTPANCVPLALNALTVALPDDFERLIRSLPPPTCGLKSKVADPPRIVVPPPATLEPNTVSTPAEPSVIVILPADRKSTRLNSSHSSISYAVFCLKKKKKNKKESEYKRKTNKNNEVIRI